MPNKWLTKPRFLIKISSYTRNLKIQQIRSEVKQNLYRYPKSTKDPMRL